MMGGSAKSYLRIFQKTQIPTQLFVIFTSGGIDFVGGYTLYQWLRTTLRVAGESSLIGGGGANGLGKP
jgi:hypothetical protein